jgi:hypothetical protein
MKQQRLLCPYPRYAKHQIGDDPGYASSYTCAESSPAPQESLRTVRMGISDIAGGTLDAGGCMSIQAAANELTKEIERLTKIRDSLLVGVATPSVPVAPVASPSAKKATKKTAAKKVAKRAAKKVATASAVAPAKKRVMSEATKKKISDGHKRRAAAAKKAAAEK